MVTVIEEEHSPGSRRGHAPSLTRRLCKASFACQMTDTQAAARLGESSGTCSFHFRQLAKYGFCEEAPGGKGREKPWRATATFTSWGTTPGDPERAEAQRHLDTVIA